MLKNPQNIRHLRAFLAVAEHNSINRATQIVFLSQPAITHAIAKLEKIMSCTLFIRKSDGMYLTKSGELYHNRAQRALAIIQEGICQTLGLNTGGASNKATQLLSAITTTQLRTLVALTSAKSYSLAAQKLEISQSSVRRSSRDLEALLDITLYEKTSIGIAPNKGALRLTKAANLAFNELTQAKEEVFNLQNIEIGQLKIGGILPLSSPVLPDSIIAFAAKKPNFKFSLSNINSHYDLQNANLDVLIEPLRTQLNDELIQQELFSSNIVLVTRPNHPLTNAVELHKADLANYLWVIPEEGTPPRERYNALAETLNQQQGAAIEASSVVIMRQILENSDRIAIVSSQMIQRELADKALQLIPFQLLNNEQPIAMTYRKDWLPTATQQEFLDMLKFEACRTKR